MRELESELVMNLVMADSRGLSCGFLKSIICVEEFNR